MCVCVRGVLCVCVCENDTVNNPPYHSGNTLMQEGMNSDPDDAELATSPSIIEVTPNNVRMLILLITLTYHVFS